MSENNTPVETKQSPKSTKSRASRGGRNKRAAKKTTENTATGETVEKVQHTPKKFAVFISNLPFKYRNIDVANLVAKFGDAYGHVLRKGYRSRGSAFASFETREQAEACVAGLNNTTVDDRVITVALHRDLTGEPKPPKAPKAKAEPKAPAAAKTTDGEATEKIKHTPKKFAVFISNIPFKYRNIDVANLVAKFGDAYGRVLRKGYRSRGSAFASFETREQAEACVAGLNNTTVDDRVIAVTLHRDLANPPVAAEDATTSQ